MLAVASTPISTTIAGPNASTMAMAIAASMALPTPIPSSHASVPSLFSLPSTSAVTTTSVLQGGLTLGESSIPLPDKIVQKILALRYVELSELLPETWLLQHDSPMGQTSLFAQFKRQKGPVSNILQWVQCFATLASVLGSAYPQKISELLAYMATIVKCSRKFEGPAWVLYDRAFRRQAEVSRDLNWSKLNPSLFNLYFTGRARKRMLCHLCLAEGHSADTCPEANWHWPLGVAGLPQPRSSPASSLQQMGQRRTPRQSTFDQSHRGSQFEICRLFNNKHGNKCSFKPCRYVHICSSCKESGHGASSCPGLSDRKKAREQ